MNKQNKQTSSIKLDVPSLIPWTEYVGKVVDTSDSEIIVESTQRISIPVPADILTKFKAIIQNGKHIGILALDDGSIRFRSVSC